MTVAVLGNGPVGQTTALLLARWGVPVILLDGRPSRDLVGSKAICQQRDVLDVWEAVGVGRRIADEGVTWTTARTFYGEKELFSRTIGDGVRSEFPPFVNLSQSRTEELLDERIASEPLVEVRWGWRVVDIGQDSSGVTVVSETAAGEREVAVSYAVACVGARGENVRSALGVSFGGRSFDDRFLICDIRAELAGWASERRFYFDPPWNPGRQVLIHPCPDSVFRIDWQVPGDFDLDLEEVDGGLDRRIRAILGETGYEILWKSVYRFHSRVVDRMRVGRVLLAGDCAHLMAPFGARGLNSGVADAENAAWKLAYVVHGWAGEGLLESYHDERHAAAVENLAVTGETMDFLVPRGAEQVLRRRTVLERAVFDVEARSEVNSGRLSEPFCYAESPLSTPGVGGVGAVVPDVPTSAGRLRGVARDGFLLLVGPGVDVGAAVEGMGSPVRVLEVDGLLGVGELWVVRPDAHVAAVVSEPDCVAVVRALKRAVGES
jgi:3-(3-hydroxy-phenyl)propionate hydroxylase